VSLQTALRQALAAQAQPEQAAAMQAYMKSAMPFYGVPKPTLNRVVRDVSSRMPPLPTCKALGQLLHTLWLEAQHREERYAALALLRLPGQRKLLTTELLPAVTVMLSTDPWWDFNDEISGHVLGRLLENEPAVMKPLLRQWARGSDLWLRRAAMLAQRSVKQGFDAVLLYETVLPSVPKSPLANAHTAELAKEFFIQKGMGWALRERSYAAPEEVQAFCAAYAGQLAPLTVREALKVIKKRLDTSDP
jgi:3-methyladenine DNA glycosylase AlkD